VHHPLSAALWRSGAAKPPPRATANTIAATSRNLYLLRIGAESHRLAAMSRRGVQGMETAMAFSGLDLFACLFFLAVWLGFSWASHSPNLSRISLNRLMNRERARWMDTMMTRELRVIDTSVLAGLQQGTAFFASTTVFAIGGCFALMNASDQVISVFRSLPVSLPSSRSMFEMKAAGLLLIYSYAFFKFGWSYRLQNYCSILVGAVPLVLNGETVPDDVRKAAKKALIFNQLAGRHFNAGLRAVFFSIGFMGWFAGPYVFFGSTFFILGVLARRQFFSKSRAALLEAGDGN
jgi:uncharacterized membrane protein